MKSKLIIIFSVMLSVMTVTSCNDSFLETESIGALSSFWKTKEDAELGLTATYDALQANFIVAERGDQNDASMREWECFTDNAMNGFLFQNFNGIKTGALLSTDIYAVSNIWRALYAGVNRANLVISNVPGIEGLADINKQRIVAQAKFLRAYFYYNLLVGWDNVPLITTPAQTLDESFEITVSPAVAVYKQIESDLIDAAANLPATWGSDYGRATSGAANAMLARVYLYGYGYLGQSTDLQKAADAAKKVIDSGLYSLFTTGGTAAFGALFTQENERSKEIIFPIRFSQDLQNNNAQGFSGSGLTLAQANCLPLPNLANDYYCTDGKPISGTFRSPLYNATSFWLNRDPRWDATFIYQGERWLTNSTNVLSAATLQNRTSYAIDKYVVSNNALTGLNNNGQDFYVLRYADVLLMYAEALIELNTNLPAARAAIDQVRARAGMPSIANAEEKFPIVINQAALRDIVRHERRVELAFEYSRFPDLKRWGTMQAAYTNSANDRRVNANGTTSLILTGVSYRGTKSLVLPIPQRELDVNKNLVQNPAWQ